MANYENYISDDLLAELENGATTSNLLIDNQETEVEINNFNFRTYSTNEDLERNFKTNYDVAIPSTYLAAKLANKGELQLINWEKFNLYKLDENGVQTKDKIKTSVDALSLFSLHARKELAAYDLTDAFARDQVSENLKSAGLLNYCVPYFIQDVSFGYNLKNNIFQNTSDYSWLNIKNTLNNNINNGNIKRVATVDDYSTLYPIGRLIETNNDRVNPGDHVTSSQLTPYQGGLTIEEATNTFKEMFGDSNKKNAFLFNSDSNILLNDFAADNSQAIISYNGDLFFAMQGGDIFSSTTNKNTFARWLTNHIENNQLTLKAVKSPSTLSVMDCMVINKNRMNDENHENTAYSVIKKIALEGSDQSLYTNASKTTYNENSIQEVDETDNYVYGPMQNFDYINYTSPLLTLNAYVLNSSSAQAAGNANDKSLSTTLQNNGYLTDLYSWLKDENILEDSLYNQYIDLLVSIYNVSNNVNNNLLTRSLSDLVKDNMSWAWFNLKSTL